MGISEGHACHARSEGHACHARRMGMDYQTLRGGPDERVPPRNGRDKRVPPNVGGARLACPGKCFGIYDAWGNCETSRASS